MLQLAKITWPMGFYNGLLPVSSFISHRNAPMQHLTMTPDAEFCLVFSVEKVGSWSYLTQTIHGTICIFTLHEWLIFMVFMYVGQIYQSRPMDAFFVEDLQGFIAIHCCNAAGVIGAALHSFCLSSKIPLKKSCDFFVPSLDFHQKGKLFSVKQRHSRHSLYGIVKLLTSKNPSRTTSSKTSLHQSSTWNTTSGMASAASAGATESNITLNFCRRCEVSISSVL